MKKYKLLTPNNKILRFANYGLVSAYILSLKHKKGDTFILTNNESKKRFKYIFMNKKDLYGSEWKTIKL